MPLRHTVDCKDLGNGQVEFNALSKLDPDDPTVHFLKDIYVPSEPVIKRSPTTVYRATKMSQAELTRALNETDSKHIMFTIHGFHVQPADVMNSWRELQEQLPDVAVVPIMWPCADFKGLVKDYWGDREQAKNSAIALAEAVAKHGLKPLAWESKRIHVLAHSMGNRVFRLFAKQFRDDCCEYESRLQNAIMVAADVDDDLFSKEGNPDEKSDGRVLSRIAENVHVLYAKTDLALWSSRLMNQHDRLGRVGVSKHGLAKDLKNVHDIDCSDFNFDADPTFGHSYARVSPGRARVVRSNRPVLTALSVMLNVSRLPRRSSIIRTSCN